MEHLASSLLKTSQFSEILSENVVPKQLHQTEMSVLIFCFKYILRTFLLDVNPFDYFCQKLI